MGKRQYYYFRRLCWYKTNLKYIRVESIKETDLGTYFSQALTGLLSVKTQLSETATAGMLENTRHNDWGVLYAAANGKKTSFIRVHLMPPLWNKLLNQQIGVANLI